MGPGKLILQGDGSPDEVGILLGALSPRVSLTETSPRTRDLVSQRVDNNCSGMKLAQ